MSVFQLVQTCTLNIAQGKKGGERYVNESFHSLDPDVTVLWKPGRGKHGQIPFWDSCLLLGDEDYCWLRFDPSAGRFACLGL